MSEWILVKDRLPEVGKQVLVTGELGLSIRTRLADCDMKATHWMEIPPTPDHLGETNENELQPCPTNRSTPPSPRRVGGRRV